MEARISSIDGSLSPRASAIANHPRIGFFKATHTLPELFVQSKTEYAAITLR
jgi:hypothetical protein